MANPRPTGVKPIRLTAKRAAAICGHMKAGNFLSAAAPAAGVSVATVSRWLRKGRDVTNDDGDIITKAEEPYRQFRIDYEAACANYEVEAVSTIHTDGGWKGAAWFLARRYPERYAARTAVAAALPSAPVKTSQTDAANEERTTTPALVLILGSGGEPEPWEMADGSDEPRT